MDVLQAVLIVLVFALMLGLGATVQLSDLRRLRHAWKAPMVGVACQFGVMPLAAFLLALALGVSDGVGLSMVVIGCSPGGSTSNLFTHLSGGDLPLSITMTVVSTVAALFMMPLLLKFVYAPTFSNDDLEIPFGNVVIALLLVLVPVGLAMAVRHRSERYARFLERIGSATGVIFIVAAIVFGAVSEVRIFSVGWRVWVAAITLLPIGSVLGYWLAKAARLGKPQCRTVALETGIQNSTLSLAILALSFPKKDDEALFDEVTAFPLLYSFFLIVNAIAITFVFRRMHLAETERAKDAGKDVAQLELGEVTPSASLEDVTPTVFAEKEKGTIVEDGEGATNDQVEQV